MLSTKESTGGGRWQSTNGNGRSSSRTDGVKDDILILEEIHNQILLADTVWTEVEPPKLHGKTPPQRAAYALIHFALLAYTSLGFHL